MNPHFVYDEKLSMIDGSFQKMSIEKNEKKKSNSNEKL